MNHVLIISVIGIMNKMRYVGSVTRHDILNQVMVALGYLALLDEMVPVGSEFHGFCRQATEATKRIQRQITFTL